MSKRSFLFKLLVMLPFSLLVLPRFLPAEKAADPKLDQLRRRQAVLTSQMRQRLEDLEKRDPAYVKRNEQAFNRIKESQKSLEASAEKLAQGDAAGAFQTQADFFSEVTGVLTEGINFLRDTKEKEPPPIGTFLNKPGDQVRFPKEKKMTLGKKPFFEAKSFEKTKLVTHAADETQAEPSAEEESYMEAQDSKVEKSFPQKKESESEIKGASGEAGSLSKSGGSDTKEGESPFSGSLEGDGSKNADEGTGAGAGGSKEGSGNAAGAGVSSAAGSGNAGISAGTGEGVSSDKNPAQENGKSSGSGADAQTAGGSASAFAGSGGEGGDAQSGTEGSEKITSGKSAGAFGKGGAQAQEAGSGSAAGTGAGAGGTAIDGGESGSQSGKGSDAQSSGSGSSGVSGSGGLQQASAGAGGGDGASSGNSSAAKGNLSSGFGGSLSGAGSGSAESSGATPSSDFTGSGAEPQGAAVSSSGQNPGDSGLVDGVEASGSLDPSTLPGSASQSGATAGTGDGVPGNAGTSAAGASGAVLLEGGGGAGSSHGSGAGSDAGSGAQAASSGNQGAQGSSAGAGSATGTSGTNQNAAEAGGQGPQTGVLRQTQNPDPEQTLDTNPENKNITRTELIEKQTNLEDTFNTEKPAKKSTRMTQSEGDDFSEKQEKTESKGSDEKQETLQQDDTVSNIQEWLLQERLLLQELKRFKPVRQPNNPNPPWEYYILRQKQMIDHLKQLRRRIEFAGKKDEYFMELQKLSAFANRLLELVNRGDFTEYQAAGTAIEDLMKEQESLAGSSVEKEKNVMNYRPQEEAQVPDEYQAMIARYFKKLSEE